MSNSNEPSSWIPTSFSSNPDSTEADSYSSCQSTTPGSTAVDHQSDDQSFDAVSRYKLNLTLTTSSTSHDRSSPKSPRVPGMSMFEEDTRSSWTVEPKLTELKETNLDDDSRNSVDSHKCTNEMPSSCDAQPVPDKELNMTNIIQSSCDVQPVPDQELNMKNIIPGSCDVQPVSDNELNMKNIIPGSSDVQPVPDKELNMKNIIPNSCDMQQVPEKELSMKNIIPTSCNDQPVPDKDLKISNAIQSSCDVQSVPDKKLSMKNIIQDNKIEKDYISEEKNEEKVTISEDIVLEKNKEKLLDTDSNNDSFDQKDFDEVKSVWNVDTTSRDSKKEKVEEDMSIDEESQNSLSCVKSPLGISAPQESNLWDEKDQTEGKDVAIDEDSQISINSAKSSEKVTLSPKLTENTTEEPKIISSSVLEEDSQSSIISQKSRSSHKSSKQRSSEEERLKGAFSAENLFEYMWPKDSGDFFLLQEQICDYLNIKSFKRKYPELARRPVDKDEKIFLKEKGVVTEMQCDLGLTALRSEEVLELMSKDYPDHYRDYIKILREKEQQSITEKHKEYVASNSDKTKMVDLVKKAMQSAAEYNSHLNQERREERRSCMDLQTYTIHYPVKKSQKPKTNIKPGKYPVALLPGQFQDYYKVYTPNELKYLPLNSVMYGPLRELQSTKALSDGSQSDSEDSSASEGSCCSSSQGTHDESSSGSEKNENGRNQPSTEKNGASSETTYHPKIKPNAICKVCKRGPEGKSEELVHCSECDNSAHPSCIELTSEVVDVLKTYPWQCMDCKVCSHCSDPNDEDKMLFCDFCDRGYHTFCVGLKSLPQGKWVCRRCGSCSICGVTKPGPETSKAQWQYDSSKGVVELDSNRRPKIMCQTCFKKKR